MTALRQTAMKELEKLPEDKVSFILQIMQGVNGLYNDNQSERKEAFTRLEQLRKKGTVTDYDAELASYREEKYLLTRKPFYEEAKKVMLTCTEGNTKGCIAAHSISNMFFILRKDYDAKERREILSGLCTIFDIEGIDKNKLLSGLRNEDYRKII